MGRTHQDPDRLWVFKPGRRKNGAYAFNYRGAFIDLRLDGPQTPEKDREAQQRCLIEKAKRDDRLEGDSLPVYVTLNKWLTWLKTRPANLGGPVARNTLKRLRLFVQSFVDLYGEKDGADVTKEDIVNWLRHQEGARTYRHRVRKGVGGEERFVERVTKWGPNTSAKALSDLRSFFTWAQRQGALRNSPFTTAGGIPDLDLGRKVRKKKGDKYRGKKVLMEMGGHVALVKAAARRPDKDFAILLCLLEGSGARPSEIIGATLEEWRPEKKAFEIDCDDPANEDRIKLRGCYRYVYIRPEVLPLLESLISKYQGRPVRNALGQMETPLFRTEKGAHPGRPLDYNAVAKRFRKAVEALNRGAGREVVPAKVTLGGYRHAYATNWLTDPATRDDLAGLAEVMGTSIAKIQETYSHLFKQHGELYDRVSRSGAAKYNPHRPTPHTSAPGGPPNG